MFGTQDIILIGIIVVVLFGATKLPQLGKGLREGLSNFKKSMKEANEIDVTPKKDSPEEEITKKEETAKKED